MTFDVLYEPWIPVKSIDGAAAKLGILPLLKNAHKLLAISSPSPLVEYGIYRLLCAFLMDMLRPETTEDLDDLLSAGQFPKERLESYREECIAEGVSFDLFDEERPFLQAAHDPRWDSEKNVKPAAQLNRAIPSGNNHMLFEHAPGDYRLSPGEAMECLCTVSYFCTSGTEGPSYVNGAPPIYALPLGENLFQTLVYSLLPQDASPVPYADPPVLWRSKTPVEPEKKIAATSLLFGMTLPTRRMRLVPNMDGFVYKVYYQKGLDYQGYDGWTDPHVAYILTEKGRSSLKPQLEKDAWRNTGFLLGGECGKGSYMAPPVVKQFHEIGLSNVLKLVLYGTATSNAEYMETQRAELALPKKLLANEYGCQLISAGLQDTEGTAKSLKYAVQRLFSGTGQGEAESTKCLASFYAECQSLFWSQLCPQATEADINNEESKKIRPNWIADVCKVAKKEFERCADSIDMSGRHFLLRSEAEKTLMLELKRMQKGDK